MSLTYSFTVFRTFSPSKPAKSLHTQKNRQFFNEPEENVAQSNPRILEINEYIRTIDATRHRGVGGNLENFPRRAITMGMKQCLEARRMLLMTRNESTEFLWANTIIRISALGAPGDDYPVTHERNHKNLLIVSDKGTLQKTKFNI